MTSKLFRAHGNFCASHPWEVIVTTLTLTVCVFTVERQQHQQQNVNSVATASSSSLASSVSYKTHVCPGCFWSEVEYNAADMIVMTIIRCLAVLYSYYQFCNLHRLGSKYILGIAGLFTVFSSFIFSSTVINFFRSDIADLKDALFFFLLLIDLSKAALLAQFALSSSCRDEVKHNIARGMSSLGPAITLDTVVETLVIGVGTLSGVRRLEVLCFFACLSVIVNYIVFMTFYPACLSLILELSRNTDSDYTRLYNDASRTLFSGSLREEDEKPNPVVQRVKLIMSAGLMLVHAHSRWPLRDDEDDISPMLNGREYNMSLNNTDETPLHGYIMKWVTVSADQIVILILLLALAIKFIFFESKDDIVRMAEQKKIASQKTNEIKTRGVISIIGNSRNSIDKEIQTEINISNDSKESDLEHKCPTSINTAKNIVRDLDECLQIYKSEFGASGLTDDEVVSLVQHKHISLYQIEKAVDNAERGVGIRRRVLGKAGGFTSALVNLPYEHYDYSKVMGACCENVIGIVPVPVGIAGPLLLDGHLIHVPMATTEGCLVASTNRGSRALLGCGVTSRVVADGMTRGPVVRFPSVSRASEAMAWMENPSNFVLIKESFDSTSRYARLSRISIRIAGRYLFVRFVAKTGDAMGMNMLSKGTETSLRFVRTSFPDMEIVSLSGNFCTDKKPAAVNWIEGRGKSVVCEAVVPGNVIASVLKTSARALVDVNMSKNMIGSAIAGSVGGFNAHAANVVTAIFIATGQDPAQNVTSSNCMTLMETWGEDGDDLYVSVTMPSIEIGTVGGGTILPPQGACLEMLGVRGAHADTPGENANQLARIVCATVLAGELSLMSALAAGHLVGSHLKHNRSSTAVTSTM